MKIEEMKARKHELGYSYEQISELSGVPVGTVQKVLGGITKSPRCSTLQALEKVLKDSTWDLPYENLSESSKDSDTIAEPAAAYSVKIRQSGEYTLDDYYALPDEHRAELIDGVFYDLAAPTSTHQLLGGKIYQVLAEYINRKKGNCIPAYAPLDVQLDCDDRTMVQPDVLVVCDREKFKRGVVFGAPDLVIEILSKSTGKKDRYLKLMKYANAGVREYWMVDPDCKVVIVYDLEQDLPPKIYGFQEKVPVGIFAGKCEVDFSEIYEYVKFLYEEDRNK